MNFCRIAAVAFPTVFLFFGTTVDARKWTDVSGRFSLEADLVSKTSNEVTLRRTDGSTVNVPIARLSAGDRKYLQDLESAKPDGAKARELYWELVGPTLEIHRTPDGVCRIDVGRLLINPNLKPNGSGIGDAKWKGHDISVSSTRTSAGSSLVTGVWFDGKLVRRKDSLDEFKPKLSEAEKAKKKKLAAEAAELLLKARRIARTNPQLAQKHLTKIIDDYPNTPAWDAAVDLSGKLAGIFAPGGRPLPGRRPVAPPAGGRQPRRPQ